MSKYEKAEREIREFHKVWLAEYIAKTIDVKHRIYRKDDLESYKYFYNSSEDSFIYSKEEEREIYNMVDSILTEKYNLLVANNAFDDTHIYLVDLGKED